MPGSGKERPKAHILFLCQPLTGHITPTLRVASELGRRGWPVSFVGPTTHRARISAAGVHFVPLKGDADVDDLLYYSPDSPAPPVPGFHSLAWYERALVDLEKHCLEPLATQWECVKDALAGIHEKHPDLPVLIISEAFFHGILPLYFGAPLPDGVKRPPTTLCLSVTPPALRSIDLPPFDHPLPFSQTPEGRARNARCWDYWAELTAPLKRLLDTKLAASGATSFPDGPVLDGTNYTCHSAILQVGVPSFEYPRSDWPPQFQFVGFLPLASPPPGGYPNLPSWWDEVTTTTDERTKKVVVVAQGTVETNPYDLIIPTMEAMRGREDVLVAAIMGRKGAGLPAGFDMPTNARVTDYLHYDAILPHARVWVHNGGYGAITHGIAHGVPMVVAGEGQDKPENIRRVRYSGIGVGLGTSSPSIQDLRSSLEDVLREAKYTERVRVLRQEAIDLDCFGRIENAVLKALV
ncbi:family 1 glycosyltransferase [Cryphonectria parasitica EP155]|uniref:Family 1 glycosyltransferase n=1 Tax=Cryphonectria parasitica (strain ATCC 38755 / EP155) TaxID=660469 RepID=A0A9P4Y328_CRYP1|nr:family 1 glycosyltransferase [Cryphonectria parasitica EP155]KAF3765255.1 family 1 glycosyltransferase [Cryphonectria parasitica EP155]